MNKQYLIKVIQKQTLYFNIEAQSESHAKELANEKNQNLIEAMPPEIEQIIVKCIGDS